MQFLIQMTSLSGSRENGPELHVLLHAWFVETLLLPSSPQSTNSSCTLLISEKGGSGFLFCFVFDSSDEAIRITMLVTFYIGEDRMLF